MRGSGAADAAVDGVVLIYRYGHITDEPRAWRFASKLPTSPLVAGLRPGASTRPSFRTDFDHASRPSSTSPLLSPPLDLLSRAFDILPCLRFTPAAHLDVRGPLAIAPTAPAGNTAAAALELCMLGWVGVVGFAAGKLGGDVWSAGAFEVWKAGGISVRSKEYI